MARIRKLHLRDVRCFEGEQSARLGRRITLLVGENGAGKSTFMGCCKALAKLARLNDLAEENHFDGTPFHLGGFGSIVRSGKADFTVGGTFEDHCHASVSFTFQPSGDLPIDRELQLRLPSSGTASRDVRIVTPDEPDVALRFAGPGFTFDFRRSEISYRSIATWLSRYVGRGHLPFAGDLEAFRNQTRERGSEREREFVRFSNFLRRDLRFPEPDSLTVHAPPPALPNRARSYSARPPHLSPEEGGALFGFLRDMGERLHLWRDIAVVNAADSACAEVHVDTPNGWRNLVDVGYGVHSLLPLLSAIARQPPKTVLLLQQPEVHVHPQAQAGLAQWMAESGRSFMIETHSDHFVDRFRICVMKEVLAPDDLSIVHFQPDHDGTHSRIHDIAVDAQGNLEGPPPEYRSFFLKETRDLLGFE